MSKKFLFYSNKFKERDLIALDTKTNRVLYFTVQEDIDELKIRTSILHKLVFFYFNI